MEFLWIMEEGREIRKKEKGKEIIKEDIFLDSKSETVEKTDSQDWVKDTENISENTEIVRNSSVSERLVKFTKNQ